MTMYIASRISMSVRPIEVDRVTASYAVLPDGRKRALVSEYECIAETPWTARYMLCERIRVEIVNMENSLRFAQSRLAECMKIPLSDSAGQ